MALSGKPFVSESRFVSQIMVTVPLLSFRSDMIANLQNSSVIHLLLNLGVL